MLAARRINLGGVIGALVLVLAAGAIARAQDGPAMSVAPSMSSTPSAYSPGAVRTIEGRPAAGGPLGVPGPQGMPSGSPNQPGTSGQPAAKSDGAKSKEAVPPVHRPSAPTTSPNRDEFKVRPDASGKVRFSFNDQPWQPVLEWLAVVSGMSLDWQELPGDSINLRTRRSYTVAEARDLINQHLLARGFTLLCHGEVLSVAEIKKLDPSLVPRVDPAELSKRDPHEFVKVSFPLEVFAADAATNELKPMLSPNGKLYALSETNRLEAMDAVLNLRDIDGVLRQQQSHASKSFREFKLKYARAEDVRKVLGTILGAESPATPGAPGMPGQPGGMNPQQAAMMAQAQAQAQAAAGGQPPNGRQPGKESSVTLAVNLRNNSILAQARPDKMAIIAQVIDAVDIPLANEGLSPVNMGRMQMYRLSGIDPEPVVRTLTDIGNLDPTTRLEIDKKNSAIIAYAPLADHVTIRALVGKLTGSDRKFEVIRLHRLAADYVAGTIDFMLGSGKKEQQRRSPYVSYYDPMRQEDANKTREFRVDADVEHNRLLLWANPVELAEVEALLIKLGEMPSTGGRAATVRMIDSGDAKETQELLKRIEKVWPTVAPNALLAPTATDAVDNRRESALPPRVLPTSTDSKPTTTPAEERPIPTSRTTSSCPRNSGSFLTSAPPPGSDDRTAAGRSSDSDTPASPPVKITIGPDGKLIVSSQDTQALDLLEELAAGLPADRKDYKVFHLKYALASSVALNLEDFFKEKKEDRPRDIYSIIYGYSDQNDSQDERRLSNRRKLKFISDSDTNTILVEGADVRQLTTIDELIQLYDQPLPTDTQSVRKTELIRLQYSKAKAVADTVKDVYRDLLSSNDKALADNNQGRNAPTRYVIDYGSDTDSAGQKTPKFKGLLSIGIDETSNSLLVSAPAFLFDHVTKMIHQLDEAAAPNYEVRVMRVGPGISAARVKEVLDEVYNQKSAEKQPADQPGGEKQPAGPRSKTSKPGGRNKPQQTAS